MALKVLMVGGRRCGKTSALAVMFDQMINGVTRNFFTTSDATHYETKDGERQDTVTSKVLELKRFLHGRNTKTFLSDAGPNINEWKYKIKMQIPGTNRNLEIEYLDVPGEWFRTGAIDEHDGTLYAEKINLRFKEYDVFVIMVDTPYLMETPEYIYDPANCISDIKNNITFIDNTHPAPSLGGILGHLLAGISTYAKMVVFVPIKCEKWVKESKLNEVVERLKDAYNTMITALSAYEKMSICILPIETAGNIHFSEMQEALKLNGNDLKDRCCKVSGKMVRMQDGTMRTLKEGDILNIDMDSVMGNTGIIRPYAWYHVDNNANPRGYAPHNCDQLTLHILKFYVQKVLNESPAGILGRLWSIFFGGIRKEEMIAKLNQMEAAHVIKENVDGIEYIKRAF